MTEQEIQCVADRTTKHVLWAIEQQLRDFAAEMTPEIPADTALLAMADDIRDSISPITKSSLRCVASNPHFGERDGMAHRDGASLGERTDRSGRDSTAAQPGHQAGCQTLGPLHAGEGGGESEGHVEGALAHNVVDLNYALACRDVESAIADIVELTHRTVARVKAEAARQRSCDTDPAA